MSNTRGAGRKPQAVKKERVIFYVLADKVKEFKNEAQPIANRLNGAEKVIEAVTFAEKAKGKKQASKIKFVIPPPTEAQMQNFQDAIFSPAKTNEQIEKQIADIKAEKIPKERDTPLGRKSWLFDQNKKIEELKKQIK